MIIKCPECGKEISSEAPICPNCGAQNKQIVEKNSNKTKSLIFSLLGIAGFALFAIFKHPFTLGLGIGGIVASIIASCKKTK